MPIARSDRFRRHLSVRALSAAGTLSPLLVAWTREEGALVELRPRDTVSVYHRGRRALHLAGLGSPGTTLAVADGEAAPLPLLDAALLADAWRQACAAIDGGRRVPEREDVARLLSSGLTDLFVVDQEVQVPVAALDHVSAAGLRPDALLLDTAGTLWLVEAKRADGADLHAVLPQLVATDGLPDALAGGRSVFIEHYREVLAQKAVLGLVPERLLSTSIRAIRTALVVIGRRGRALARIAAWEAPPDGIWAAVVDEELGSADFTPLRALADEALRGVREGAVVPVAPRPSRWNEFTASEDERLAGQPPSPPLPDALTAYLAAHDAPAHSHAGHPRSSQRACLDAFAPAFIGGAGADALMVIVAPAFRDLGVVPVRLDAVDFEVPHQGLCRERGCAVAHDMRSLAGESDPRFTTRLDVALAVKAERAGQTVRVLVGVEFKYTEPEFGCCGGFESEGNPDEGRRACLETGERADRCYLLRRKRRRYLADRSMFQADPLSTPGPCLLLGPANQLYRSHFVVRELARAWGFDDHLFIVVADERNTSLRDPEPAIPGHARPTTPPFDRYRDALRPELRDHVYWTSPQAVASAMRGRGLELPRRYSWASTP